MPDREDPLKTVQFGGYEVAETPCRECGAGPWETCQSRLLWWTWLRRRMHVSRHCDDALGSEGEAP